MNKQTTEATKKVTDRILSQLEQGNLPPWSSGRNTVMTRAYNVASKRFYKGINQMVLSSYEYQHNVWGTFQNWNKLGTHIRSGEAAAYVVAWKRKVFTKTVLNSAGEEESKEITYWAPYTHAIFNLHQTAMTDEQIAKLLPTAVPTSDEDYPEAEEIANAYLTRSGVKLTFSDSTIPCYRIQADTIVMPSKKVFTSTDHYISTMFHEEAHSTGAKGRLNRTFGTAFGSEAYSFEELVAECTAAILCSMTGVVNSRTIDNQAAYIQSWLKALKGNTDWILSAAGLAQKAVDLILLDSK